MATNKRKESAALFELIGKSTLKVPKNAAGLKIPEWWSSKTNPPPAPPKTASVSSDEESPEVAAAESETSAPAQHRLFDPPPQNTDSAVSPSIRPPGPAMANGSSSSVAARSAPPASTSDLSATPKPARSNPVRIFAPQTMSQSAIPLRRGAMGGNGSDSYRRNGRIPLWALIMAVVVLILIVITVVAAIYTWINSRHTPAKKTVAPSVLTVQPNNVVPPPTASLLPPVAPSQPPVNNVAGQNNTSDATATKGTVYGPGAIQRSPDLYYVIITQTPTASVAQKDADFLADHGIDVSIETSTGPGGKGYWYRLVSVQGYPTLVTANPFRKKIVLIGHLSDDFKKGKPMWDDAFLAKVKSNVSPAPGR